MGQGDLNFFALPATDLDVPCEDFSWVPRLPAGGLVR